MRWRQSAPAGSDVLGARPQSSVARLFACRPTSGRGKMSRRGTPMAQQDVSVQALTRDIIEDVYTGLNWAPDSWLRPVFRPLTWLGAYQFARLCSRFDRDVAGSGIASAMHSMLLHFATTVEVSGAEQVPPEGPLLVLANHPGTFDSIFVSAMLRRDDLQILAWGWPLLRRLPATSRHMIYATDDPHQRMGVFRAAIRGLKAGAAVLIFPTSDLDPDPDAQPGSVEAFQNWSPSVEMLLKQAPAARVQIAIMSGVLVPRFLRHPLARLPKSVKSQRTVAELLQMLQQLVLPRSLRVVPRLSFGRPTTLEELTSGPGAPGIYQGIVTEAETVLAQHMAPPRPAPYRLEGRPL
jgi:1-acyl-sn-glycerol-3-phosphate acyltransferase